MFRRIAIWVIGIANLATTAPEVLGYIHYPPMTLQKMCHHSHHIRALKVEKLDKEKGIVVFENTESLKGRNSLITSFRHFLRPEEEGTQQILARLEKGKLAVMFAIEGTGPTPAGIGYVFIDKYCYTVDYNQSGECWLLIRAEPEMSACYYGAADQLSGFVKDILAGREVDVPVKEPKPKEEWAKRYKEVNDVFDKIRDARKAEAREKDDKFLERTQAR